MKASTQYNSNLFRQDENVEDDFSFRFSPTIVVASEGGRLEWDVGYRPNYSDFVEFDDRDKWNHVANAKGSYLLGPRTRISFFDQFSFTENTPNRQIDPNSSSASDINTSTRRSLRNTLGLTLSQGITSRLTWSASASHVLSDVDGGNRSNFTSISGTTQLSYALSRRNTWGLGAGYNWVGFSDSNSDDLTVTGGSNHTVRIFASWSYAYSDSLSFRINGGPARVIQDQADQFTRNYPGPGNFTIEGVDRPLFLDLSGCQQEGGEFFNCTGGTAFALVVDDAEVAANTKFADAGELSSQREKLPSSQRGSDTNDTFFAEAQIVKRWEKVTLTGTYRRSQNPESSASTTSIVDVVRGSLSYKPNRLWSFGLTASWNQRESSNEQAVDRRLIYKNSGLLGRTAGSSDLIPATQPVAEFVDEEFDLTNQGLDVTQWSASVRVGRRITDHLRASMRFNAVRNESDSQRSGTSNDFDEYRVSLGFNYTFRPRRLF